MIEHLFSTSALFVGLIFCGFMVVVGMSQTAKASDEEKEKTFTLFIDIFAVGALIVGMGFGAVADWACDRNEQRAEASVTSHE